MTIDPIRLAKIEEAKQKHADAVLAAPETGRINGKRQKLTQQPNTVGNVLSFTDQGIKRKFVISVAVTSIDPEWKPQHAKDIAPDNGCKSQLRQYQDAIEIFLNELHDSIEVI
jgi:hypothetical protein